MRWKNSYVATTAALALVSASAIAAESVTINGRVHTCTNSCVVTVRADGSYSVTDSDGGRVRITIPSTQAK